MAYSRKTEATWKEVSGMDGFSVIGSKERFTISFEIEKDLRISVNGCRVVSGKNGEFISFPQWKDKNGSYHNYAYFTFSPDEVKMIIGSLA